MARRPSRSPRPVFPILPPPRVRRFLSRHQLLLLLFTGLVIFSGVLGGASLLILRSSAASPGVLPSPASNVTFQQFLKQGQQDLASRTPLVPAGATNKGLTSKQTTNYGTLLPPAEPPTMQPITQALSSTFLSGATSAAPLDLVGSDGRLELQVPPGALDVSQATAPGGAAPSGALRLQVTQLQGHSVGEMNGLGSYQLQVIDSQGQALSGIRLTHPLTLRYHYQ
ncbi:MAG TPA: hypothetical protein VKT25_12040, partial [Ktedonobacteraceae bacterium]|nr:hypothetical protein [Ktedonobacteraceae bacterium]